MPRQMYSRFMFLFFIRYVRNRIDHWCTVEPGNPNPRVHRSSGKLGEASFPTGTVDPRVGISLSPLNTNDGFSLSGVQEFYPAKIKIKSNQMDTCFTIIHLDMFYLGSTKNSKWPLWSPGKI